MATPTNPNMNRPSWILCREIQAEIVSKFKEKLDAVDTNYGNEILFKAFKEWRPKFLKLTTIRDVVEVPADAERLAVLEVENARLRAALEGGEPLPDPPESELVSLIEDAIIRGLEKDNAQMVGKALEYVQDLQAKEFLSHLEIEIVPYTIKDTSLEEIILRAPEAIVKKCEAALLKRRQMGRTNPKEPLTWEKEYAGSKAAR
jgi:hypothetical protein